jgi:hypothetical protein
MIGRAARVGGPPASVRSAAAGLVAVLALGGCGTSRPGGPAVPTTHPAAGTAGDLRAFAIFRRAARPSDQIPAIQAVGGVTPHPSRRAYAGPLGMVFAYVHAGSLCVSYETRISASAGSGIGLCDALGAASRSGVALPVPAMFDRIDRIALLLPDGVRTVTLTRAAGAPVTVPVKANAVVYGSPGLRAWSFTRPDGVRETGLVRQAAAGAARP